MIVYGDILFLINFIGTYIMLKIMCFYKHKKLPFSRKVTAAAAGGINSLVIFLLDLPHYIISIIYFLSMLIINIIAFGKKGLAKNIMTFCMLFLMCEGAIMLCISLFGNNLGLIVKNNIIYMDVELKIMVCAFAAAYPLICIFSKLIYEKASKKIYELTVINKGKSITVSALFDSGNLLCEPVSGKSVIIFDEQTASKIKAENQELIQIPYASVGGDGYIEAFLPDILILDNKHILESQYIGITKQNLSYADEYNALIGNIGGI